MEFFTTELITLSTINQQQSIILSIINNHLSIMQSIINQRQSTTQFIINNQPFTTQSTSPCSIMLSTTMLSTSTNLSTITK